MILVDAGPLVALIDQGQGEEHRQCMEARAGLTGPLLTTWPCLAEAMYLLSKLRGWSGQAALWDFITARALLIHGVASPITTAEAERMRELMEKYHDVPMDLADASLVAVAETTGLRQIFTLDDDFYVYRINDRDSFAVIPLL